VTEKPTLLDSLLGEFTDVIGLEPVDAARSAFTALAVARGWTKARVGRYLGISRARVGQKVDKLEHYAFTHGDKTPVLTGLMDQATRRAPARAAMDGLVEFTIEDWSDDAFRDTLLNQVVPVA
jgi:hypothetical protein